ncbi:MAG: ethanolamine utilization microcompartment protein EutL [Ignavibacteriaceae bacterium]|nr:ethanolamine utilization microcompartment protein EutL [Ignavibacterium sp.]MCC6255138.1 ethanolamine utilization microcompartment protein EutL [Ignavibacteriaceae bacterium]HRN25194.1 ethanolamine utilization microcompartment protein EutL [Ignavibacteriaceae bacterium]HRP93533.1 ethanolamine utilization microcompartment protein EutL [Ignavibacteriaceae bacterium]HRQ54895.1 ethanolamine utilization microcompartment protein EutL [Ignavibacteriaceae bacterium]
MATLDPITANVLAVRLISSVDSGFAKHLNLPEKHRSVGLLTCDIDDACYVAIDEATKMADVEVIYAKSFYAGSAHASGKLSGEIIAMLSGPTPGEVESGLNSAIDYIKNRAIWYSANEDNTITFFPHLISRTGSYLSKVAGINTGDALAYLIAPPLEANYAIDLALKRASVEIKTWFAPPSETNYSGALLTGTQAACQAACDAFQEAVLEVAQTPIRYQLHVR